MVISASKLSTTVQPIHIILFVALNAVDVALTMTALSLGAREINVLFASFNHPLEISAVKLTLVGLILLGLVVARRVYLMHWLNAGMTLVVIWNVIAVLSWSLPLDRLITS